MNPDSFNLIAAKLEEAKIDAIRRLNEDLFRIDGPIRPYIRYPRWKRWRDRMRGYVTVLWMALCGRDLEERNEDW